MTIGRVPLALVVVGALVAALAALEIAFFIVAGSLDDDVLPPKAAATSDR
jgi:hypothetical protein